MTPQRKTITTADAGTYTEDFFDGKSVLTNFNTARITGIEFTFDDYLCSITVHYMDDVGVVVHGGVGGERQEILLRPDEFITMIQGSISDDIVSGVSFATNIGNKWGPFGRVNASTAFIWGGFEPEMGLLYFSGQEGDYIFSLRATFAAYEQPATRPAEVRYEKYAVEGPDPAAATLSEFTTYSSPSPPHAPSHTLYRNLMSPTVSLVIGPNCTLFRTSQCILCRLPFFRAALQGGFLEASDQRITMPEDEPQFVAALIEFLYTGSYTYPYRASREIGGETAVKLLTPKYGSTELGDAALKAFMFVLRELKGIDVLNLWEAAYEKDLTLKVVEERAEVVTFRIGLPLLMRELYTLHPTEMREMSEAYPALLDDLCRMLVFNA